MMIGLEKYLRNIRTIGGSLFLQFASAYMNSVTNTEREEPAAA
jgi:hypothetical protein